MVDLLYFFPYGASLLRLCDYCEVRPSAIVQLSIYVFVIFNITAFLANIQYISLLLSPIRRTRGQRIRRRCRAVDEESSGRRIDDVAEQWTRRAVDDASDDVAEQWTRRAVDDASDDVADNTGTSSIHRRLDNIQSHLFNLFYSLLPRV